MRYFSQLSQVTVWISLFFFALSAWAQSSSSFSVAEKIIRAARFDDVSTIKKYADQQGDINLAEAVRGETLLMISVRENSQRVFDYLLMHPKIHLDQRAKNGDTAIMLTAYLEQKDKLQRLIDAGAQVNQAGWTALHYATVVGNLEIVKILLEHYAYIDAETPNKTTPLMLAARRGEMSVLKLLIDEGADISLKNMLGWTAHDFAVESERRDIAALLQELMQAKTSERK
ncbi:ankyrin repeat domain-containing protein [Undibacterium amnicola]|uniref:Ankyrin repeat domain-containing protein n=1 Tax=Undibacterium amnicola TaxID=1834038 RepID=A0ABR6XMG9_9BURK|nr:ankyrin repeat domain-containing protein [Undibacterium amnicola]MBC3830616.1 ankyrin repeat domain-containing protein [Undibacterium amnicola]